MEEYSNSITETVATRLSQPDNDDYSNIPVYREFNDESSAPKWKQLLYRFLPQPIRNSLKPPIDKKEWKKFLYTHLPIIYWVINYYPKNLIGDFVAGITLGVTQIPQGIGFALLAIVPPTFGLYSSFIPVLIYSIFGTSRHLSVGTFPVTALITGQVVNRFTFSLCHETNMTNMSTVDSGSGCDLSECHFERVNVAITLTLMVGLISIFMSFLRMGVITLLLSNALISGYTCAAAFAVFVTQWENILGLDRTEAAVKTGYFLTPKRVIRYLDLLFHGRVSVAAIVTSIICFIILISCELANYLLKKKVKKIPIFIPGQLILVVFAIIVSYVSKISSLPVIKDDGGILSGKWYSNSFKPIIPVFSLIDGKMVIEAFVIAVISFVINIAQAKLLAQKNGYSIHPDQEWFAYGISNLGGSFFGSFPTAGALSRTLLQDLTGGKTQLVGIISSVIVIIVILFLGFLFNPLPNAAIGVIVIMALKGLYFQVRDVRRYFYLNWPDMLIWLVVFSSTLIISLELGLAIGVIFSMFVIVVRTILPYSSRLGEAKVWIYPPSASNSRQYDSTIVQDIPGVFIYQFNAPLYFANCSVFRSRLFIEIGINPNQFQVENKGCFEQCYDKAKTHNRPRDMYDPLYTGRNRKESQDTSVNVSNDKFGDTPYVAVKDNKRELKEMSSPNDRYHTLIIDCAPIGFIDASGLTMLEKVVKEFNSVHIQVLLAGPSTPICEALDRYGFFNRFSSTCLFPSVASAVSFAKGGHVVPKLEDVKKVNKIFVSNLERILSKSKRFGIFDKCITNNDQNYEDPRVFLESTF